ncbi:MAG: M20/M25/M40 family metallo-hydrolase [Thermodesulfobacteriota bacterium]
MIKIFHICILLLFFLPTLSFGTEPDEITTQDLISHISYLASDELEGRKAGTEGANLAANYIESEFKKAGLKPLGDDGTYFQEFSLISGIRLGDSNSFKIEYGDNINDLKIKDDYLPLSFSSTGGVGGDLVFAGYGISAPELGYDDYKDLDVKDKIVLVLRFTPEGYDPKSKFYKYATFRSKAINARKKGAKGIIFVTPSSDREEENLGGMRLDASFTDSGIHAVILRRGIAEKVLNFAGKDLPSLEQEFAAKRNIGFKLPNVRIGLNTDLIQEKGSSYNVIGILEGSSPELRDEAIIIGAHYDHIGMGERFSREEGSKKIVHNGADDNASGAAGLIELAKYFSDRKENLQRSIVFIAFSAEELGLLGSSYYVSNPRIPLYNTIAMINMDMIGRLRDGKLTILGAGSSPEWKGLLDAANSGIELGFSLDESGFAPSDQSVFYAKNIPVLQFFTGVHSDYHSPGDDWEKINYIGEREVLKLVSNLISELETKPIRIAYSRAQDEKKVPTGLNVYLGTIPDYSDNTRGVKLMGVKQGSPAERAGLKGGDIIVEFAGDTIKNIYDYVYALAEAKPGINVDMIVIRDNKNLRLGVVPEPRIVVEQ